MTIDINLKLSLDASELEILCGLFKCKEEDLAGKLAPYVTAAGHEYVDMFTGNGPIAGLADTRERRLVSIIRHGLKDSLPASLVAQLFKMPLSTASALIRSVSAKHEVKVGPTLRVAYLKIVGKAIPDERDGKPRVIIPDSGVARYLNDIIKQSEKALTPVKLVEGSANRYEMDVKTKDYLFEALK